MTYLIFTVGAFVLMLAFFALTSYEKSRGFRVFSPVRSRLDREVARVEFILEHVDLAAFLRDEMRHTASRFGHFVAQLSLQAVRTAERLLTRLVLRLRTRHPEVTFPRETTRPFVKKLSDFKDRLKAMRSDGADTKK